MVIYQKGDLKSQFDIDWKSYTELQNVHINIINFINLIADSSSVNNVVRSSNAAIEGHPYNLSCEVSGNSKVSWIKDSTDEHRVGKILNFTSISRSDTGSYTCETSNRCGNDSKTESINVVCKYYVLQAW